MRMWKPSSNYVAAVFEVWTCFGVAGALDKKEAFAVFACESNEHEMVASRVQSTPILTFSLISYPGDGSHDIWDRVQRAETLIVKEVTLGSVKTWLAEAVAHETEKNPTLYKYSPKNE